MRTKPVNPYTTLRNEFREFVSSVKYAHTQTMWVYKKAEIDTQSYRVDTALLERVRAANQLGYDVVLKSNEDADLVVQYVKRPALTFIA